MAERETPALASELPAARRSVDQVTSERVLGHDLAESARGAQVKEAAAFERQERRALRGHQLDYSHRQRAELAGEGVQSARSILVAQGHQLALFGARVHVSVGHVGVLARCRQEASRDGDQCAKDRA